MEKLNGKSSSFDNSIESELLNPFIHHLELTTTYDKIKTAILTVAVLPFRVAAICGLLVLAWCFACIGLFGLSEEDLRTKPMTGWRKDTKSVICEVMKMLYMAGSFHRVKVTGRQASRSEAPMLALAPHSSYFDSLVVVWLGGPSIVAKGEVAKLPFFGKLMNYTQPVYVWREDPNSRHNTIKEIIGRVKSGLDWPQVLIFPEGTCTNRSCLITFKPGAFYPGVPVQPVCIKYPNKLDTITWTWEGPGVLKLLWLTLTQIHSSCEIEFLPVYRPSPEEQNDPKLFANNVRQLMAKALGVPVSNYTYDDCRLMTRAKELNLCYSSSSVEIKKLRQQLELNNDKIITKNKYVTIQEFAELLGASPDNSSLQLLFRIFDKNSTGEIDFREYELAVLTLNYIDNPSQMLSNIFQALDEIENGRITLKSLTNVLSNTISFSEDECERIFEQMDPLSRGYVTLQELENFAVTSSEFGRFYTKTQSE